MLVIRVVRWNTVVNVDTLQAGRALLRTACLRKTEKARTAGSVGQNYQIIEENVVFDILVTMASVIGIFAILSFLIVSITQAYFWTPIIRFHYIDPMTNESLNSRIVEIAGEPTRIIYCRIAIGFDDLNKKLEGRWADVKVPTAPWMRRIYYRLFNKEEWGTIQESGISV